MANDYEVLLDGISAGKMQVTNQGLYFHFFCMCQIMTKEIYRVVAYWDGGYINLGIPAPEEGKLILKKKIAAKHIEENDLKFVLLPIDRPIDDSLRDSKQATQEVKEEDGERLLDSPVTNGICDVEEKTKTSIESDAQYVPIEPGMPFMMLEKAEESRLDILQGDPVLVIGKQRDQIEMERPTGQWSEPSISE